MRERDQARWLPRRAFFQWGNDHCRRVLKIIQDVDKWPANPFKRFGPDALRHMATIWSSSIPWPQIWSTPDQTCWLLDLECCPQRQQIPIVFASVGDPVGAGLIHSLNRPGGNVTGVTSEASDVKRLQLFDLLPGKRTRSFYESGYAVLGARIAEAEEDSRGDGTTDPGVRSKKRRSGPGRRRSREG